MMQHAEASDPRLLLRDLRGDGLPKNRSEELSPAFDQL
jgi:hypothetical protein